MKILKKTLKTIQKKKKIGIFLFLFGIFCLVSTIKAQDLLEQAFQPSIARDQIIDLGNTKNAVGNEILRESIDAELDLKRCKDSYGNAISIPALERNRERLSKEAYCKEQGGTRDNSIIDVSTRQPLIVRIAKILLRITIVLAITMVLYSGVMFIYQAASGQELGSIEAKKNLFYIIGGLLLALFSLAIINLISSIGLSSIFKDDPANNASDSSTSEDIDDKNLVCKDQTFNKKEDLKKYICLETNFGGVVRNERLGSNCGIWEIDKKINIGKNDKENWCTLVGGIRNKGGLFGDSTCKLNATTYKEGYSYPNRNLERIVCILYFFGKRENNTNNCLNGIKRSNINISDSEKKMRCETMGGLFNTNSLDCYYNGQDYTICEKFFEGKIENDKCLYAKKLEYKSIGLQEQKEYCTQDNTSNTEIDHGVIDSSRSKVYRCDICYDGDGCFCETTNNVSKDIQYGEKCTPCP